MHKYIHRRELVDSFWTVSSHVCVFCLFSMYRSSHLSLHIYLFTFISSHVWVCCLFSCIGVVSLHICLFAYVSSHLSLRIYLFAFISSLVWVCCLSSCIGLVSLRICLFAYVSSRMSLRICLFSCMASHIWVVSAHLSLLQYLDIVLLMYESLVSSQVWVFYLFSFCLFSCRYTVAEMHRMP